MRQEEYKALVQAARETDLVTYFQQNGFTVERKGSEFYVKEYPSLCIKPSTNQWYFHYTREGATNNSINCLTKVLGMDFNQAVFSLTGQDISRMRSADFPKSQRPAMTTPPRMPRRKPEKKELQMPEQSEKTGRLFAYLCQTRKIPPHQMQRELAESRKKIAELESAQSSPFKAFYYSSPDKQAWVQQQLDERVIPYRETENGFEAQACYVQTIRRIEQDFRVPRTSARDRLREDVDRMLMQSRSFDELLARLERAHYEVKRGKYIAVKPQNFGTFIRLKSLGEFYSEAALRNRLFEKLAYEQKLVREMEQAKMSNAPNYRVLAMQHYYIISFSKGYLPVRKKNPNRVLSWVNDAELYRLTALNAKINEGATLDSLRADITEKEEAIRRIERTRDGCDDSDQKLIMRLNAALIHAEYELRDAAELLATAGQVLGGTFLQVIGEAERQRRESDYIPNGTKPGGNTR